MKHLAGLTIPLTPWSILITLFFDGRRLSDPRVRCLPQTKKKKTSLDYCSKRVQRIRF